MNNDHNYNAGDRVTPVSYPSSEKFWITGMGENGVVYAQSDETKRFGKIIPFHHTELRPWDAKDRAAAGAKLCPVGTRIQTLIFDKRSFSHTEAVQWAQDHDFNAAVDEKENTWRMRQLPPSGFKDNSFRTINITKGIKAVIGCPKAEKGGMLINTPTAAKGTVVKLTPTEPDFFNRKTYKGSDGNNYVDIEGVINIATPEGEPMYVIQNANYEIVSPPTASRGAQALAKDRKYTSSQPHEKRYKLKRKSKVLHYKRAARGVRVTGYDKVKWEAMRKEIKSKKAAIEAHELDAYDFMARLSKKYIQKHDPKWAERTVSKADPFADRMLEIFDEEGVKIDYERGGRLPQALSKDRKYTSSQPHEERYKLKRKSRVLFYTKNK